jgi:hypothetical protein
LTGYQNNAKGVSLSFLFSGRQTPFWGTKAENGEVPARLSKTGEVVIPGNPGEGRGRLGIQSRPERDSKNSGFRLSPE